MAADPSLLGDSSSPTRTATGVAIALLVVATVGAAAMIAPRLREEFREDIFSAPRPASAVVAPRPVAASPVPMGSLAPGEAEVAAPAIPTATAAVAARSEAPAPAPVLKKATKLAKRPHHPPRNAHRAGSTAPRAEPARPHSHHAPWTALRAPRDWRPGVNRDAPSASPTDPQPGA